MDFFAVGVVVDIESHKGALLLFTYLNGADSCTKLQFFVFALY